MTAFEPQLEAMRGEALRQVQLERLQALLARLRRNVRRSRDLLGAARVESLADLKALPMTTPEDLVEAFPYGMFALPLREVVRLHSTLGPEGRRLVVGHTRNDLRHWGRLAARQLIAAGVTASDVIQIRFDSGAFTPSLGFLLGAEMIGASVIPEDSLHVDDQLEIMGNYRATVLITTPSNARALAAALAANDRDPQSLPLRTLVLSRPVGPAEREALASGLMAAVRCSFGIGEVVDPGIAVECECGRLHAHEDHFLVEVDNGELVVTTLTREAMPLLRFRTRIAARLEEHRCDCGRAGVTILPEARLDGRLRVNEVPLYRHQIAAVLDRTPAAGRPFRLEIEERRIVLDLEVSAEVFRDEMRVLADLRNDLRSEFLNRLGVEAEVRYVSPPA